MVGMGFVEKSNKGYLSFTRSIPVSPPVHVLLQQLRQRLLRSSRVIKRNEVSFRIPEGETMRMAVENVEIGSDSATASVIKDAGDDPDVTNGCRISATVSYASHPGISFHGGKGIGTVTLSGLGLDIGEPAINPVPRKNISDELSAIYQGGLDVTISLEMGKHYVTRRSIPESE